jgi:hypothetical protein
MKSNTPNILTSLWIIIVDALASISLYCGPKLLAFISNPAFLMMDLESFLQNHAPLRRYICDSQVCFAIGSF